MRVFLGITGASGAPYARRLVQSLAAAACEVGVCASGAAIEVLATNVLNDRIDASPAVVGKEIFLRGHQHLYCIAEK